MYHQGCISRLQTAQTSQTQPNYQAQPNNFKMSDKQQREFNNLRDEQAAQNRGSMKEHWEAKLLGKKVVDGAVSEASTFSKNDLPSGHRVLGKDSMMTLDYRPERLNVHVDEDGTCNRISMG
ncbi:uncharacterized protein LAJ45_07319 [Morchella importuna]|nr:uncharacterized protein LAJ45_07319 [Morchella importuna]KAH8148608.1 hypothetical protein LAJ45_07319 [Morchella importuna]